MLAPWKKCYDNLDSILRSRDITLPTKICIVWAMVFPVVMYRCEIWTIKKAEHWRIVALEVCWRRFLRVLWTASRSNQSIIKEINPDYSLEELILNLNSNIWATLWEEPTHQKRSWCQEKLKAREEGGRKWELDSIIDSVDISLSKIWETMEDRGAWNTAVHRVTE